MIVRESQTRSLTDTLVLFSRFNLKWEGEPITHSTILYRMTPEQVELFSVKCLKSLAQDADLVLAAIQGVLSSVFGKTAFTPSDLLDMRLGYEVEGVKPPGPPEPDEWLPATRRAAKFGHWKMDDADLIQWLAWRNLTHGGDHELSKFFTQDELDAYGICLIGDGDND